MDTEISATGLNDACGYVTPNEIAEYLGISIEAVRDMIRNRKFPAIPRGKKSYIIPLISFFKWITDPDKLVEFRSFCEEEDDE